MKTLTIKVPEELALKLQAIAARRGESQSAVIRAALEDLTAAEKIANPRSCLDLAGDLVGCAAGPADLSCDPKHLQGYGR